MDVNSACGQTGRMRLHEDHDGTAASCPRCGWPETEPYEVVSRHPTSNGTVVYTRCLCGLLHVRRSRGARPGAPLARGSRPAPAVSFGPLPESPAHRCGTGSGEQPHHER